MTAMVEGKRHEESRTDGGHCDTVKTVR
ncbi:hypothetical protein E2C01_099996 [Portunus trituberculatus]|uniref:Uncharacterized protein n=1 Tax=Portunus trituberculatus TaxID=210409 RepID=A0A5B7KBU4_PORTR|nr:hypothetical protein [Portunus trituberculatus]